MGSQRAIQEVFAGLPSPKRENGNVPVHLAQSCLGRRGLVGRGRGLGGVGEAISQFWHFPAWEVELGNPSFSLCNWN